MKNPRREAEAMAKQAGLEVVAIVKSGGNHFKLTLRRADGVEALFFAPCSPSDPRGDKNRLADYRRFAKGFWNPICQRNIG